MADLLERRWQLSIIYAALSGALRFSEFAEAVAGISPRMLSERLRDLEAAGLTDVILPERNRPDLDDVPEDVREQMTFHPVMTIGEVLDVALEGAPVVQPAA